MWILANSGARPVILDRGDSYEQLSQKFPGLVERRVLFTLTSEFYQTKLQLYMIKVDVELVRFGILVDGVDLHQTLNTTGQTSDVIECQPMELSRTANKLTCDFPTNVQDDILSGRFALRLKRYQRQRGGRRP
jgi:hypothetical protein